MPLILLFFPKHILLFCGVFMRIYTDKYSYLFGPVPSRRLGRSLGIDIIPRKICTLNCIYCEVGRTTECITDRRHFDNPDDIIAEFAESYPALKDKLDIVTITGAGEPTLNLDFGYILKEIKRLSEHPLAVLTNTTLFTDEDVRRELMNADVVVPSIDAATPEIYRQICAPHRSLDINQINEALVSFTHEFGGKVLIEVLLCEGINDGTEELGKIAGIIKRCRYELVQLNTVHRPPAFSRAKAVPEKTLLEAALFFKSEGIKVEHVGNYIREFEGQGLNPEKLERLISMRPCCMEDISKVFGVSEDDVKKVLSQIDRDRLKITPHRGRDFFFLK